MVGWIFLWVGDALVREMFPGVLMAHDLTGGL
jgi:hypothetical protein